MATQQPTPAPPEFVKLLKQSFDHSGLTLAEAANKADISLAYLSRLLNGERGAPAIGIITRLEEVFDIQPRGLLFDAAGLHDSVVSKVLKKDNARVLMRAIGKLNKEQMDIVLNVAEGLTKKQPEE